MVQKLGMILLILAVCFPVLPAQEKSVQAAEAPKPIDWSALNLIGSDTTMPLSTDALIPPTSAFRDKLARHGLVLRTNASNFFFQNVLEAPIAADRQSYVGQRATWRLMINNFLIYDLRALGLHNAQFFLSGGTNQVSWEANGPDAAAITSLNVYKAFAGKRLEVKAGYLNNDWEFVCLIVGGSVSAGTQGVYAVLPYEAGLSHFPMISPGINLRGQITKSLYAKVGAQRSLDAASGHTTISRNQVGLRFAPKGDKLLMIYEGGYKTASSANSRMTWIRAGYMRNATQFKNYRVGGTSNGNYSGYLLADRQLTQAGYGGVANGLYGGFSLMANPASMNIYSRYAEARLYRKGAFQSRPRDLASVVATYTVNSPDYLKTLIVQNKSFWRGASTLSANYVFSLRPGLYSTLGVTYNSAPAATPKVAHAVVPTVQINYYF